MLARASCRGNGPARGRKLLWLVWYLISEGETSARWRAAEG